MKEACHQQFTRLLNERILILDGAMGTMIQRHGLSEADYRGARFADFPHDVKGNNDLLSLTQGELIQDIHRAFLQVGADIIETNTFSSTSVGMADYHMQDWVGEINRESVRLAKAACAEFSAKTPDKPRFVAGSIGPTNRTLSMSPEVNSPAFRSITFSELADAYQEQICALIEAGVDLLLIETVFDTLNAKAALYACEQAFTQLGTRLPIMVSGTITDASGRTLSGQTPEAFAISVSHAPLLSLGLNCALGATELLPHLEAIAKTTPFFVSAHPNAGLPNAFGEYDETPESMALAVKDFLDLGLCNILGGCCGTTPEHIEKLAELAKHYPPRQRPTL